MATMNRGSLLFLVSVGIQLLALISLATASPLLLREVVSGTGLPWGNLLTWLLFTLFPVNFLVIRRQSPVHPFPRLVYRFCVYAAIILGFLWLFVSYFLSGNWSATFHGEDTSSAIWKYYTYTTPLLPFIGYFLMRVLMIFFRKAQ